MLNPRFSASRPSVAFLTAALAPVLSSPASAATDNRPNVVVILVDDMGFSDIGCYGGEIPTPNIDALAAGGLRYTQFYNTGRCCPTRAALLTGQYAHATGIGHMTGDKGPEHPAFRGHLNDRCATLGELLRPAGYLTAHTGKWHVGSRVAEHRPLGRGFDRVFSVPEGGGFYFRLKKGRTVRLGDEVKYSAESQPPSDWYTTDAWTDWGIRFIDQARGDGKPFFLYLAHNAPHFPLQAAPEDVEPFRGTYLDGWDTFRERRFARQKELGLFDEDVALSPRPDAVDAWSTLSPEDRDRSDHVMACYAAVMTRLDRAVGKLVAALRDRDELDRTLILFLSDNGASAEGGDYGKLEGDLPGSAESSVYEGRAWATLSNTPFRRHKMSSHQGGTSTPLIVHWPDQIKDAGAFRRQVGHVIDIVPTVLAACHTSYPNALGGRPLRAPDGVSLVPTFTDASADLGRDRLFWEHEGNRAVRDGDWKLVSTADGAWELYDLRSDPTERTDVAADRPERAAEMRRFWDEWAAAMKFRPGEWRVKRAKGKVQKKAREKNAA